MTSIQPCKEILAGRSCEQDNIWRKSQSACNGEWCTNFFLFKNCRSCAEPLLRHGSTFYPDCQLFLLKQLSTNTYLSYWLLSSKKSNQNSVKILKMFLHCMKCDLLEITPKRDVLFIIGYWNAKVGSQETPGVTGKFGLGVQNEAGQRLIEFCQKNALVIANTLFQQHKRRLCTWASPDGRHRNQIDYILCSQRWRSSIQSAKTRLEADCVSDHELLIAKFRLKSKKVEKTTRPFRYDLN